MAVSTNKGSFETEVSKKCFCKQSINFHSYGDLLRNRRLNTLGNLLMQVREEIKDQLMVCPEGFFFFLGVHPVLIKIDLDRRRT